MTARTAGDCDCLRFSQTALKEKPALLRRSNDRGNPRFDALPEHPVTVTKTRSTRLERNSLAFGVRLLSMGVVEESKRADGPG